MNPKHVLTILILVMPVWVSAIHHNSPEGGRSAAMAGSSVALNDFWSVQNNQAGLAFNNHFGAGAYFENRFLVKELSLKAAGAVLSTKSGVFGFNFTYFGYPKYNESKIALAYARSFGNVFAASVQLDYLITSISDDYGNKGVPTFEVGLMSKVNEDFTLAAHIFTSPASLIALYPLRFLSGFVPFTFQPLLSGIFQIPPPTFSRPYHG